MSIKSKLLLRQLKKLGLDSEKTPGQEEWCKLLKQIDNAYCDAEEGRYLLERALSISSKEMKETMEKQKEINLHLTQASKMASLGTLASGVAHELNNPLAGIRGHAEILFYDSKLVEDDFNRVSRILALTDRAAKIVKHLLKLARKPSDEDVGSCSLSETISDSIQIMRSHLKYDNVQLAVDDIDENIFVLGKSHSLVSVFQNLINNSYDEFMRAKAGLPEEFKIEISLDEAKTNNSQAVINITDNAGGIPENIIESVFDPFFTTKDVGKGTGLGLTLVKRLVEEAGGSIQVSSSGVETCFSICLKKVDGKGLTVKAPAEVDSGLLHFAPKDVYLRKVLIVDDEKDLLDILSIKLRGGFEVSATESPTNAIQLLKENKYDLLITDLKMPTISGLDIITHAREQSPEIAICLISGHAQAADEYMNEVRSNNVVFIEKPLPSKEEFKQLIEKAFALAKGQKKAA